MSNIMDLVRQKKQSIQAQSGRKAKTHKPQPGKNKYRILPGWRNDANDPMFYHDFGQHFVKDLKGNLKAIYVCTEKTYGKPCPICDQINEALAGGVDEQVAEALGEAKSKGRVLMNALHLNGDDKTTPVILDLTPTTFEKVLEVMEEYGDITQLEGGVDLVINRTGQGLNTEYSVMAAAKSAKLPESIMKGVHDLDEYVKQEYDDGRNKAIAAVSSVSGLLPAPSSSSAGQASQPSNDVPQTDVFDPAEDDDIPFDTDDILTAAETPEPTVAVDETATDDDELEAMLAELEG